MPNALAAATSPYLLQHQDNPVDWREWNEATLALARAENRPILLSVGYAACHWCHVMAHESFENAGDRRRVMNRLFVNIKVDREERPDLDTVYQQALAVMGQQGGWPLTMFLTPERRAVLGRHLLPARAALRPARASSRCWSRWPSSGAAATSGSPATARPSARPCSRLAAPEPGEPLPAGAGRAGRARSMAERFDTIHGGLAGAPKFPQAPILRLIWEEALAQRRPRPCATASLHTLARICQGGIYDHLGGGFARYSVDAYWLVPHFEKMLYDNAQLLELLASAHAATGEPLFAARAEETVGLAAARDAGRGRLRLGARRRQRGRGGPVLRLGRGRDRPAPGQRRADLPPRLRRHRRRQLGGRATSSTGCTSRACRPTARPTVLARCRADPARRARAADPARPRRQGAGRLERPDDRGPGPGVGPARPARLARAGRATPSPPSCAT